MIYFTSMWIPADRMASSKAPMDIYSICKSEGFKNIELHNCPYKLRKFIEPFWHSKLVPAQWALKTAKVKKGDTVFYQYPMYFARPAHVEAIKKLNAKGVKTVVLIHDLETKRYEDLLSTEGNSSAFDELAFINSFDKIICHNPVMADYLELKGINREKIVSLGLFDYLLEGVKQKETSAKAEETSVAIAGNLSPEKCGYIYEFAKNNPELHINLYGVNYDDGANLANVSYCGSFEPEQLPLALSGDYGIIWDGPTSRTCDGVTGKYLTINNPHKTSAYLASGRPVICWSESAISGIITEYDAGIAVDSLDNLTEVLASITDDRYETMKQGAAKLQEKILNGSFTKAALKNAGVL